MIAFAFEIDQVWRGGKSVFSLSPLKWATNGKGMRPQSQMARALTMELDKNAKTPMLAKKQPSCMQSGLEWSDTEH